MKFSSLTHGLFIVLLFISHWAFAQTPSELQFQSRYDQFELRRSGGQYMLGDRRVKLGSFEQFLSLFNKEIEGDCSLKGKPDLTVKGKYGGAWVERRFYIAERVVSDGKQCATIGGDGLYFSPLHRSWFDDTAKSTIALKSPLTLSRGDAKLASFTQAKGEWVNSIKGEFPNWEFFSSFQDSLRDFTISHRVHKAAIAGKPGFTLTSGKRKYEFYKLGDSLWVTTLPGSAWLVASARWTSWADMENPNGLIATVTS